MYILYMMKRSTRLVRQIFIEASKEEKEEHDLIDQHKQTVMRDFGVSPQYHLFVYSLLPKIKYV